MGVPTTKNCGCPVMRELLGSEFYNGARPIERNSPKHLASRPRAQELERLDRIVAAPIRSPISIASQVANLDDRIDEPKQASLCKS